MSRSSIALLMFALSLSLSACQSGDNADADAPKVAAAPAVLHAPTSNDDKLWKSYLQQVVGQHMAGVTDRVSPYYLPADSTTPTPGDPDNKSQFDRQKENVASVVARSVLPGNMLVFGSPDSAKMGDLVVAAFTGGAADALKGSQVLFIGKTEDSARVQAAVEAVGAKYIFVEAK
jgi:hypothetical protein